jgi:hypothetical protein
MSKARYSIWVREHGSDHDVELCGVDSNPEPLKTALYAKRIKVGKGKQIARYDYIRVVDNGGKHD